MASRRAGLREHSQTRAYEVFRFRRRAVWAGLGKGALTILGATGVVLYVIFRAEVFRPTSAAFWYWTQGAPAVVLVPLGAWLWWKARGLDRIHRQFQQAPSLPLLLLRDHDDAWVHGRIRCPLPLRPPAYAYRCSWYHLVVEERRGSGKHQRWVKVLDQTRRTRVFITGATREIQIDMPKASIDYPIVTQRGDGFRRSKLSRLPAEGMISACGVVRYRKDVRGPPDAVPDAEPPEAREARSKRMRAILTRSPHDRDEDLPRTKAYRAWHPRHEKSQVKEEGRALRGSRRRRQRVVRRARAKRGEVPRRTWDRRGYRTHEREAVDPWHATSVDDAHGVPMEKRLLLTPLGHVPLMVTPLERATWHDRAEADETSTRIHGDVVLAYGIPTLVWTVGCLLGWWGLAVAPGGPVGVGVMLAVLLPSKVIARYNRFVVYRQRIPNARSYLDVDLKMRHDLLPQLVRVVQAFAEHERGLQTQLAGVRETVARGAEVTGALLALREAYPALAAQPNFASLLDDIKALEEKIAFGRALLRDTITEYNSLVETFPSSLLAALTGFRPERLPGRSD